MRGVNDETRLQHMETITTDAFHVQHMTTFNSALSGSPILMKFLNQAQNLVLIAIS